MIPRYQKILLAILLIASLGMGIELWQLRDRAHKRLLAGETTAPTKAPEVAPAEQATLIAANDLTTPSSPRCIPCRCPPTPEPAPAPSSANCLTSTLPPTPPTPFPAEQPPSPRSSSCPYPAQSHARPRDQLAVVNLTGSFAASHPSGLETESLTVLSICATIRANLPHVTEVRFLVDGQARPTLAGHADLTRTYLTADATPTEGTRP